MVTFLRTFGTRRPICVAAVLAIFIGGCGADEQLTDDQLRERMVGIWSFKQSDFSGKLNMRSGGTAIMSVQGTSLVNTRFRGDVKYRWHIADGALRLEPTDTSNHLLQVFPWKAGSGKDGDLIEKAEKDRLVLGGGMELTRVP